MGPMTDQEKPPEPKKTREQQDAEAQMALRDEFLESIRACSRRERRWIKHLIKEGGEPYPAGRAAGIGKATVFNYLRRPHTQRAFELVHAILRLDLGVSLFSQLREYKRQGYAKLRDAYYPKGAKDASGKVIEGQLKPPHEWDEDTAAAICEHSYDKDGRPTIKMHAKGVALGALDKLLNLGPPQRLELTGKNGESLNQAVPIIQFARYSDSETPPGAKPDGDDPDSQA